MMLKFSVLLTLVCACYGYKVLVVFPIPGRSHIILGEGYVRHLLNAGHEVTYVTPKLIEDAPPNLHQIDVSDNQKLFVTELFSIKTIMYKEKDIQDHKLMYHSMDNLWKKTLKMDVMQKFLSESKVNFDVVIVEWLYTEIGAGIASVFNCPLIWSSSMDPHTLILHLTHEHLNPAYAIDHLSKNHSPTFWGRLDQLYRLLEIIYFKWSIAAKENEEFKALYGPIFAKRGKGVPDYDDVRYNASVTLGNSDINAGDGIPLPQSYKHIGGYHIKEITEPLPKDLQEIMDNAKYGVIYFSMGSNLRSSDIPDKVKRGLLKVFSELKQTVIWKLETTLPDIPKNVHILQWAPQPSILSHPNCVLFVTHGGLLSILEILHFGIPFVGIPFFADQYLNVNRVVAKGIAKRLDFNENSPDELRVVLKEMLEDSSYRQRAKEVSKAFNDKLLPPGKELVHWVEHVVKTKGAPHLRSAALHVSWYKKIYLDLISVLVFILIFILTVFKYFLNDKVDIQKNMKKIL